MLQQKQAYEAPEARVSELAADDVITTSAGLYSPMLDDTVSW